LKKISFTLFLKEKLFIYLPIFDSLLCVLLSPATETEYLPSRQNDHHPSGVRLGSKQKLSQLKAKCWMNAEEK